MRLLSQFVSAREFLHQEDEIVLKPPPFYSLRYTILLKANKARAVVTVHWSLVESPFLIRIFV